MADVKPRLTDYEGAAAYAATTVRHLRRLVYEHRIPFVKIGGKVRFDFADLDRWIKQNRTGAIR